MRRTGTPLAIKAAREELRRRGVGETPSWVEWLERWPGRAAFAEEEDAPEAAEAGEKALEHYLEVVESRCLYCGAREPLQFHPFVALGPPSEVLSRTVAAMAVVVVGVSLGIVTGWVSRRVGRAIIDGGRGESLLLHFVLCDGCASQAVNDEDAFPPEVYGLHPWVAPLMQVGYDGMVLDPDHPTMVQAAKRLGRPPSEIGITMV